MEEGEVMFVRIRPRPSHDRGIQEYNRGDACLTLTIPLHSSTLLYTPLHATLLLFTPLLSTPNYTLHVRRRQCRCHKYVSTVLLDAPGPRVVGIG